MSRVAAYQETFGEVEPSWRTVVVGDGRGALEWTATGTGATGALIAYSGDSILEMADGRIARFRTYVDPNDLGQQIGQGA